MEGGEQDCKPGLPKANWLTGLAMYKSLQEHHGKLEQRYGFLVIKRLQLLERETDAANLSSHMMECFHFTKLLLALVRPAQGRLSALLGQKCADQLSHSLLLDFIFHLHHYLEGMRAKTYKMSGPEKILHQNLAEMVLKVIKDLQLNEENLCKTGLNKEKKLNYCTNVFRFLEATLQDNMKRLQQQKKEQAEIIIRTAKQPSRPGIVPYDGILDLSHAVEEVQPQGLVADLANVTSVVASVATMLINSYPSIREIELPNTFYQYMKLVGSNILAVIDKLEPKDVISKDSYSLQIYLECFTYVAKTTNVISYEDRRDNCLSPRFDISLDDVMKAFEETALPRNKCKDPCCQYLRNLNEGTMFEESARTKESLELLDDSEVNEAVKKLHHNVVGYLKSLVLKTVIQTTEAVVESSLGADNNVAFIICHKALRDVISRLSGRSAELDEGCAEDHAVLYESLVQFAFLPLVSHTIRDRNAPLLVKFFQSSAKLLQQLSSLTKPSKDLPMPAASYLAKYLGLCTLKFLFFGMNSENQFFKGYIDGFYESNLTILYENVMHYIPEDATRSYSDILYNLIICVKINNQSANKTLCSNHHTSIKHEGQGLSTAILDYYDNDACIIASFVAIMLSLYNCCHYFNMSLCLQKLEDAGLCCCLDASFIFKRLLGENLQKRTEPDVQDMLAFIKNVVIQDLNGYNNSKQSSCSECNYQELVIVSQREDHMVDLQLKTLPMTGSKRGTGLHKVISVSASNPLVKKMIKSGNNRIDYVSLKWQGLDSYRNLLAGGNSYKAEYHAHLLYLIRTGRKEVQNVLYASIYEPRLKGILTKGFCTKENLNSDKVPALCAIFTALTILLLTNEDIEVDLTDADWEAWNSIFNGQNKTKSLRLSKCCYTFAAAVVQKSFCGRSYIPPYPDKFSYGVKCFEDIVIDAQAYMRDALQSSQQTNIEQDLVTLLYAWSSMSVLSCVPSCVSYLQQRFFTTTENWKSLAPVSTLQLLLKTLADKDSWARPYLLHHRNHTFALIKLLLTVIAVCPALHGFKCSVLQQLRRTMERLYEDTHCVKLLANAVLRVSYEQKLCKTTGHVEVVCGRAGQKEVSWDGSLSAILHITTYQNGQSSLQFMWPELVNLSLEGLLTHHKNCANNPDFDSPTLSEPDAQEPAAAVDLSSLGLASWFLGCSTTTQETKDDSSETESEKFDLPSQCCKDIEKHIESLERSLDKMIFVCEGSPRLREKLRDLNFKESLLAGFDVVLRDPKNMKGVAVLVLRLWALFARESLSAPELSTFFNLFMGSNPPVSELLATLQLLLESSMDEVQHSITFPLSKPVLYNEYNFYTVDGVQKGGLDCRLEEGGFVAVNNGRELLGIVKQFAELRAAVFDQKRLCSGLHQCVLACPFPKHSGKSWAPLSDSSSVVFWCKLNDECSLEFLNGSGNMKSGSGTDRSTYTHLFTLGTRKAMLSLFFCSETGYGRLELAKSADKDKLNVISKATLDFTELLDGHWHFLTLSLPGYNTRSPTRLQLNYSVDGNVRTETLDVKSIGYLNNEVPFILLGQRRPLQGTDSEAVRSSRLGSQTSISMTSFTAFSNVLDDQFTIKLLMAFGKNVLNYMTSEGELCAPLYKKYITPSFLQSLGDSTYESFTEKLKQKLENALLKQNQSLLFHYNARQPELFLLYVKFSDSSYESCNKYKVVKPRACLMMCGGVGMDKRPELAHSSLLKLGGVRHLLYLLARVVEMNTVNYNEVPRAILQSDVPNDIYAPLNSSFERIGSRLSYAGLQSLHPREDDHDDRKSGTEQAQCIRLLYYCVEKSPELCRQFHAMDGNSMVMRLLYSPKMDTRLELLAALLDQCFSEPLIFLDRDHSFSLDSSHYVDVPVTGYFRNPSARFVVTDPQLLSEILYHWHRVELKKLEYREKNCREKGLTEEALESCRKPERLVVDGSYGSCHSVDVLHRCASFAISSRHDTFYAFNYRQLLNMDYLLCMLSMAQVLHVADWREQQASAKVVELLLQRLLPPSGADYDVAWNKETVKELLRYLVLCMEQQTALAWHSDSCVARLVPLYRNYFRNKTVLPGRTISDLIETEIAEEVTEGLVIVHPPLNPDVIAENGMGMLTQEDVTRIEIRQEWESITDEERNARIKQLNEEMKYEYSADVAASDGTTAVGVTITFNYIGTSNSEASANSSLDSVTSPSVTPLPAITPPAASVELAGSDEAETSKTSDEIARIQLSDAAPHPSTSTLVTRITPEGGESPCPSPILLNEDLYKSNELKCHNETLVAEHLMTALLTYLRQPMTEKKFLAFVRDCIKAPQLSLLAHHKSPVVRCAVIQIFSVVLCRLSFNQTISRTFKTQLSIVHHQLSCHGSSNELLNECFMLVVSKPMRRVEAVHDGELERITANIDRELNTTSVQAWITETSAPLLAVLPKVEGLSSATVNKVINFLQSVVDHGTKTDGRLLRTEYLSESLVLTYSNIVKDSKFRVLPVADLLVNLARSMLLMGDEFASKGFDLITKFFLLCEAEKRDAGTKPGGTESFTTTMRTMGRILQNSLVCLLKAMLVESAGALTRNLSKLKNIPKKKKEQNRENNVESYISRIVQEEKDRRSSFIPSDSISGYMEDLLPLSSNLQEFVDSTQNNPTKFILRTIRLLKMASNFVVLLDWLNVDVLRIQNMEVCGMFPLFLLDLLLQVLFSWDPLTDASNRAGFVGTNKLDVHQFEVLSREYEHELRRSLPVMVCLMAHPKAHDRIKLALLARLKHERTATLVFSYCRDRAPEHFTTLGNFLMTMEKDVKNQMVRLDCIKVLGSYRRITYLELPSEVDEADRLQDIMTFLVYRKSAASSEINLDVQACMAMSIREHESHKKDISNLYNRFLVMHGTLKKKILDSIRIGDEKFEDTTIAWRKFCRTFSGEKSCWYSETATWWELVRNENFDKTRTMLAKKVMKCNERHLLGGAAQHLKPFIGPEGQISAEESIPLHSVLIDDSFYEEKRVRFPRNMNGESIEAEYTCKGWIVKPGIDFLGTILVADGIYFKGVKTVMGYHKHRDEQFESTLYLPASDMANIRRMKHRLRDVALEVHLHDNSSWFFVCDTEEDRDIVVQKLLEAAELELPSLENELETAQNKWKAGKISNFEYLMILNTLAGRTYNDLSQYPVFPYVLKDYHSDTLNLSSLHSFREISRPLPAQTHNRERLFIEKFTSNEENDLTKTGFHFSSLYSNSTIVQNYLVRLPPFTLYFLHFQGGKFDQPSRTFKCVKETYDQITELTTADFKEAIPELYYLPEMFTNPCFNFNGDVASPVVNHVALPKWAKESVRKFVLYHRAALECEHVTKHLNLWIDLIFGFKQTGKKSIEAINVYHPAVYPGQEMAEFEVMWRHMTTMYGEVPRQLFRDAHPGANKEVFDRRTMKFLSSKRAGNTLVADIWGCFAFFSMNSCGEFNCNPNTDAAVMAARLVPYVSGNLSDNFIVVPYNTLVLDAHGLEQLLHVPLHDGVARINNPSQSVTYPVFTLPACAVVTCYCSGSNQVWLGTSSGLVLNYNITFDTRDESTVEGSCSSSHQLPGHLEQVTAISLCINFNVCVSGDASGNCCIWNIREPQLLRVVEFRKSEISNLLVSSTSGDWIVAANAGSYDTSEGDRMDGKPCIGLYSINGDQAACTTVPDTVQHLAMTSLMEGRNVNVIAALFGSQIKLYSSWDLQLLTTISCKHAPVTWLGWTADSQYMLVMWNRGFQVLKSRNVSVSKSGHYDKVKFLRFTEETSNQ